MQVYVAEMARLLARGAGESNSRYHSELIRLSESVVGLRHPRHAGFQPVCTLDWGLALTPLMSCCTC